MQSVTAGGPRRSPRAPSLRALLGTSLLAVIAGACGGEDPGRRATTSPARRTSWPRLPPRRSCTSTRRLHVEGDRARPLREEVECSRALEKADITLPLRKQAEIELPSVKKEPVTVVDPVSGARRAALACATTSWPARWSRVSLAAQGSSASGCCTPSIARARSP